MMRLLHDPATDASCAPSARSPRARRAIASCRSAPYGELEGDRLRLRGFVASKDGNEFATAELDVRCAGPGGAGNRARSAVARAGRDGNSRRTRCLMRVPCVVLSACQ